MANEQDKAAQDLVTVAGGVDLEVKYQNNGHGEIVRVRQLPISKISEFLMSMGNEAMTIELYCDKPGGWADTLTIESANAVADKGQEINMPFLNAWWRRQAKWRDMQAAWMPEIDAKSAKTAASPSVSSARQSPITTT